MKHLLSIIINVFLLLAFTVSCTQKHRSKSTGDMVTETAQTAGIMVSITYSQPTVNGRILGESLEPLQGEIWHIGTEKAAVFEVDRDVLIEGKRVPKGKYSLFTILNNKLWVLIFNKTWNQTGTTAYNVENDVLRVGIKGLKNTVFTEKLYFKINTDGMVSLFWADRVVNFYVQPVP